jgi:hypothetical protein
MSEITHTGGDCVYVFRHGALDCRADPWDCLQSAVTRPTSALLVSSERTFSLIARAAGGLNSGSPKRSLDLPIDKRMVEADLPGGTEAIGGYWTRTNDPEIDLVGPIAHPSPNA